MRREEARAIRVAELEVVEAATSYVREVESPAPDLLYRRRLHDALVAAVSEHERLLREARR